MPPELIPYFTAAEQSKAAEAAADAALVAAQQASAAAKAQRLSDADALVKAVAAHYAVA